MNQISLMTAVDAPIAVSGLSKVFPGQRGATAVTALQHVDHSDIMRADFFMKSYFGRPARGASISRSFAAEPVLAQLVID